MTYPIAEIENYEKLEQLGSKEKFWYHDHADNKVKLFKIGRPNTGENWSEKVTSEIAETLELPCVKYEFATWQGKQGVISPLFVPEGGRLVHGNEVLAKIVANYPKKATYQTREYKLSSVIGILHILKNKISLPIGYNGNRAIKNPLDVFIGYLMFDCLISNPDRHHENWGFILDNKNKKAHLAPTYDHASGLGCRVSDDEIIKRIKTKDKRYTVQAFVKKAKSAFSSRKEKRISTLVAFLAAAKQNPIASNYWLNKLEILSLKKIENFFYQVPQHLISENSILFAVEILDANRSRLLNTRGLLNDDE